MAICRRLDTAHVKDLFATSRRLHVFSSGLFDVSSCTLIDTPPKATAALPEEIPTLLPLSHTICNLRRRSFEERDIRVRYVPPKAPGNDGDASEPRTPCRSWLEMTYPFSSSPQLQEEYQRFDQNRLRLGLLLEDMDGFAGDVAFRHTGRPGVTVVTAAVDEMDWLRAGGPDGGGIPLDRDLQLAGQVSWVGRSSLEVLLEARSLADPVTGVWQPVGAARFVMACRTADAAPPTSAASGSNSPAASSTTAASSGSSTGGPGGDGGGAPAPMPSSSSVSAVGDRASAGGDRASGGGDGGGGDGGGGGGRAAVCHPLRLVTDKERRVYGQAGAARAARLARKEAALAGRPITVEELTVMLDARNGGRKNGAVPVSSTRQAATLLMHQQDRNMWGRVFGGHLLREGFELAYATAAMHAGDGSLEVAAMGDVSFLASVPIGCIMQFTAQVTYVSGASIHVHVAAKRIDLDLRAPDRVLTNDFRITFVAPQKDTITSVAPQQVGTGSGSSSGSGNGLGSMPSPSVHVLPRKVYPVSISEGLRYVEAYRQESSKGGHDRSE